MKTTWEALNKEFSKGQWSAEGYIWRISEKNPEVYLQEAIDMEKLKAANPDYNHIIEGKLYLRSISKDVKSGKGVKKGLDDEGNSENIKAYSLGITHIDGEDHLHLFDLNNPVSSQEDQSSKQEEAAPELRLGDSEVVYPAIARIASQYEAKKGLQNHFKKEDALGLCFVELYQKQQAVAGDPELKLYTWQRVARIFKGFKE